MGPCQQKGTHLPRCVSAFFRHDGCTLGFLQRMVHGCRGAAVAACGGLAEGAGVGLGELAQAVEGIDAHDGGAGVEGTAGGGPLTDRKGGRAGVQDRSATSGVRLMWWP